MAEAPNTPRNTYPVVTMPSLYRSLSPSTRIGPFGVWNVGGSTRRLPSATQMSPILAMLKSMMG